MPFLCAANLNHVSEGISPRVEDCCAPWRRPYPTSPPSFACAANGRTVRSLAYVLSMYENVKMYFVAPDVVSAVAGGAGV